jgi:hypothetical protein
MARSQLRSPDDPWPLRWLLGLYEFCASLKLAVILLTSAALVLASATFVESRMGLRAVHYAIYGTWWFTLLNALLALNIFCAAAIRYPWKRHQTGFVITHIGLLTLMFGMLLSRRGGIDAQMPVFEDHTAYRAYEDSEHFELTIEPAAQGSGERNVEVVTVPFTAGPFNWDELRELPWFPWRLAKRDQGVLFDQDGIKLELLDYYSDSREIDVPAVTLALSTPRMTRQGADGRETQTPESWVPVSLSVRPAGAGYRQSRPFGIGSREMMGGGQLVYWLAGSDAEVQSFLQSQPEGAIGPQGQVVLFAGGQRFPLDVESQVGKGPIPLGDAGVTVELKEYFANAQLKSDPDEEGIHLSQGSTGEAQRPAVELLVTRGDEKPERMVLFANLPEVSQQAYRAGVFGNYWFDHGEKSSEQLLRGEGGSRIDVVTGPDGKLYYRYWNRHEVVVAAELPEDGTPVDAFKMPIAQLQLKVEKHVASNEPGRKVLPLPFNADQVAASSNRAAQVRLTVDGTSEEFWIVGPPAEVEQSPRPPFRREVAGKDRTVALRMPLDEVDVGFRVRLRDFERKLDPGTSQPSHYSSIVDFVDRQDDRKEFEEKILITMNAPVDFSDPQTGRSYRLFQEAFRGPFAQGSEVYERYYHGDTADHHYMSILTVNYDPGRGVKYLGCLLIVAGIVTMFYMRAYFFKPTDRSAERVTSAKAESSEPVALAGR